MATDQAEGGFAHALAEAIDEGELPDRCVDRALVQDLLDALQLGGALGDVELQACSANSASISG